MTRHQARAGMFLIVGGRGKHDDNSLLLTRHEENQMNETLFLHRRDHDLHHQTLIVDSACVAVSFPATHQINDGHTLDAINRILLASYHPENPSSASLLFAAE